MDERLGQMMEKKINEVFSNRVEISQIIKSLGGPSDDSYDKNSTRTAFAFGIVIGRLFNSFHYQCRRVLKRSPTEQEFSEFVEFLRQHQKELHDKIRSSM